MSEMEEKLGSILNDPKMMQQIMAMAQSIAPAQSSDASASMPVSSSPPMPEIDLAMVQKLSGLARQSSIDAQQQALLKALKPYLHDGRIRKLERAMRAAKMAKFASGALGHGGLQSLLGR